MDPRGLGRVRCLRLLSWRTGRSLRASTYCPAASAWVFRNGVLERKNSYFQPREWENQETLDPESYYRELREVFARNLPRYFGGRERIGMSLTGGLDTRMIMAWQKHQPGSLPCYTFGGMLRDCQDVIVARQVARVCEQPHQVIRVGEEFLSQFAHYAERAVYLTDGCVDVSRAPDLYLNERAREIAPVRMTGNYGGEVLRRVRAFKPEEPLPGLFAPEFLATSARRRKPMLSVLRGAPGFLCRLQAGPVASLWGAGPRADATLHAVPLPRQRLCPHRLSGARIGSRLE